MKPLHRFLVVCILFSCVLAVPFGYGELDNPAVDSPNRLMVDANRDKQMSFTNGAIYNNDVTTVEHHYRFWANDDKDSGDEPETVPVVSGDTDASHPWINGVRDLEDYTRLWISFKEITQIVKSSGGQVKLEWKPDNGGSTWGAADGSPTIRIFEAVDTDGGTQYLENSFVANNQATNVVVATVASTGGATVINLTGSTLNNLSETNPYVYLIFDGVQIGKGQLVMTVYNGSQMIEEAPPLYLEITDIKKMFPQYRVKPPALARPFDDASIPPYDPTPATFEESDRPSFLPAWDEEAKVFVFVNGSNESFPLAVNRSETMFKRLYWQGYKGRFVSFRWETLEGPFGGGIPAQYNLNEWMAWTWGESLKKFMESSNIPSDYTKNVGSHSLGCSLVSAALVRGMRPDRVILLEAAIPAGCFDVTGGVDDSSSVNGYLPMWLMEATSAATPDQAAELGYRGFVSGALGINSGVNIYSFFNASDYALFTGPLDVWEGNQELYKPDSGTPFLWNYTYNSTNVLGERGKLNRPFSSRFVTTPYESMSFVARSRSKALGAKAGVQGVIKANLDLGPGSPTDFGSTRSDHSGVFNRNIQDLQWFYQKVGDIIQ